MFISIYSCDCHNNVIQHCDRIISEYTGMSWKEGLSQVYAEMVGDKVEIESNSSSIVFDKKPSQVGH